MLRSAVLALLGPALVVGLAVPATASVRYEEPTHKELPGTNLEADERDDGSTDTPMWMLGSAIAAVVFIGVGGTVASRRMDRDPKPSS